MLRTRTTMKTRLLVWDPLAQDQLGDLPAAPAAHLPRHAKCRTPTRPGTWCQSQCLQRARPHSWAAHSPSPP